LFVISVAPTAVALFRRLAATGAVVPKHELLAECPTAGTSTPSTWR
jgi:hypothetical protein